MAPPSGLDDGRPPLEPAGLYDGIPPNFTVDVIRRGLNLSAPELHDLQNRFHDALSNAGLLERKVNTDSLKREQSAVLGGLLLGKHQPLEESQDTTVGGFSLRLRKSGRPHS
jgi:hypothetical protein